MITDLQREALEHDQVLKDIRAVLSTNHGQNFVKYLLKNFEVFDLPTVGMTGEMLNDKLGFLRAGNSVFKIVLEASPSVAGQLIADLETERQTNVKTIPDIETGS